jgi:hypothetical protein
MTFVIDVVTRGLIDADRRGPESVPAYSLEVGFLTPSPVVPGASGTPRHESRASRPSTGSRHESGPLSVGDPFASPLPRLRNRSLLARSGTH